MTFTAQHGIDKRLLTIFLPRESEEAFRALSAVSVAKHNGYLTLTVDLPHRKRSTGWKSQNHHLWGHAAQIGSELGYDRREMVYIIAGMTNGWPTAEYKGVMIPKSESTISVEVATEAIEVAHRIAAENGIRLIEDGGEWA